MEYGLIGEKLSHSYSVKIHGEFASYNYALQPIEKDMVESFIKQKKYRGLNVTIPYKQAVMPYLDDVSQVAKKIGCVNTILNDNGVLKGYNTDYYGFLYNAKRYNISFEDKEVVILGNGATSKTAQAVVGDQKPKSLTVISRTGVNNYQTVYSLVGTQIIINTTPVGTFPQVDESPIDLSKFLFLEGVIDVVYNPSRTQLLLQAQSLGVKAVNGLGMLVAQGAMACELFTGKKVSEANIERAIKSLSKDLKNIVLVGMPGSGKSTVAKLLSKKLGMPVIDTDLLIEKSENRSIPEIFSTDGEEYFRKVEKEIISKISLERGKIISTGGGVVLDKENSLSLKRNGVVYYLDRELDKLAKRNRPISIKDGVETLYQKRKDFYAYATDKKIDNNGQIEQTVNQIIGDYLQ